MFDDIYWMFLNKLYFGSLGSIEDRIQLFGRTRAKGIGWNFSGEVKQARNGILDEHYSTDALVDL
jgi:hypothetical protein